jgi:hypothetical protein
MQSLVSHDSHTAASRTRTSPGDARLFTKLNEPMGQTCLQKAAPLKNPSMTNAAVK